MIMVDSLFIFATNLHFKDVCMVIKTKGKGVGVLGIKLRVISMMKMMVKLIDNPVGSG